MKLTHRTIETAQGTMVVDSAVSLADPLALDRASNVRNSNVDARRRVLLA